MKKLFLLLAVAGVMVACGGGEKKTTDSVEGLKTDEVVLEDIFQIPAQDINLVVEDKSSSKGPKFSITASIIVEALKDEEVKEVDGWPKTPRVRMYLLDNDGVELYKIVDKSSMTKKCGQKKQCEFSTGKTEREKEKFEEIIKQTKSVRFEIFY